MLSEKAQARIERDIQCLDKFYKNYGEKLPVKFERNPGVKIRICRMCDTPARAMGSLCEYHFSLKEKSLYAKKNTKANRKCLTCGQPAKSGRFLCEHHYSIRLEESQQRQKARRKKAEAAYRKKYKERRKEYMRQYYISRRSRKFAAE